MVEITTLCERLRERYPKTRLQTDLGQKGTLMNPDGPEAATKLEQLTNDLDTVVRALEPFAKAGELFPGPPTEYEQCIYNPAAGDGYALGGNDLRAAREALSNIKREGVS